jgi:hypothetical protein
MVSTHLLYQANTTHLLNLKATNGSLLPPCSLLSMAVFLLATRNAVSIIRRNTLLRYCEYPSVRTMFTNAAGVAFGSNGVIYQTPVVDLQIGYLLGSEDGALEADLQFPRVAQGLQAG